MSKRDWKITGRLLADIMFAYGLFLGIPTLIALLMSEWESLLVFAVMQAAILLVTWIIRRRLSIHGVRFRHALLTMALAWITLSLISTIPFISTGMSYIDALFEAVSAWTDTGLTMVVTPEDLPWSVGTFRILIQLVSGLGLVLFLLMFRGTSRRAALNLFQAEGRQEDFSLNLKLLARTVLVIYLGYIGIGALLLWITGVPPYHAVTHAITSMSTGGFSTNSVGVGVYGTLPTLIAVVLMLAGGISFTSHRLLWTGKLREFWANPEVRLLFVVVVAFVILMSGILLFHRDVSPTPVLDSLFYTVTTISTCGAGTSTALSDLPQSFVFAVLILMVSGAVSGSTSGALKLWRILVLQKVVVREIKRPFLPRGTVLPLLVGDHRIEDSDALQIGAYTALYLGLGLVGSLIFMLWGYDSLDALFTVFSAQGNVGLNAMESNLYFTMPVLLKIQLVIHMLLGRMEILPMLNLLRAVFVWKR